MCLVNVFRDEGIVSRNSKSVKGAIAKFHSEILHSPYGLYKRLKRRGNLLRRGIEGDSRTFSSHNSKLAHRAEGVAAADDGRISLGAQLGGS